VIACWNVQGLKSKTGISDFREALKGVDIFGVIETWTSEKDEIELDGYKYVSRIRKRNVQIGRCSSGVGIFYKEKLYQRVQLLNNVGTNVLWIILKADEGKEGRTGIGVCYNPPRGSKYENPHFFEELDSEVLEIKSTVGELDIIVMGDINARCGDLMPRGLMEEEEENGWYKDNSFTGSSRRSEDKVVNEEGRKLISFCHHHHHRIVPVDPFRDN
jgi:exonuclease III